MHFHANEFCRVCFTSQGNLTDVTKSNERGEAETTVDKLTSCVSEVDWSSIEKIHLCQSCLGRLNSAYEFKLQCLQTNVIFKRYLKQLNGSPDVRKKKGASSTPECNDLKQKDYIEVYGKLLKEELEAGGGTEATAAALSLRLKAAQDALSQDALLSACVTATNNNKTPMSSSPSIQGILLNVIPANSLVLNNGSNAGLLHGNGVFPTFLPILAAAQQSNLADNSPTHETQHIKKELNIVQYLSESATEELSVDIDPSIFDLSQDDSTPPSTTEAAGADWDDVISCNTISSPQTPENASGISSAAAFSSMLAKATPTDSNFHDSLLNFLNVDHFMAEESLSTSYTQHKIADELYRCDKCPAMFTTLAYFRNHQQHHNKPTLSVLPKPVVVSESALVASLTSKPDFSPSSKSDALYQCDRCPSFFDSPLTFARHKSTSHNEKQPKKKYFVKGMKNARCDICNRDFSTQSYLQQHKKLHFRNSDYRLKVKNLAQLAEQSHQSGSGSPKAELSITPVPPLTPTPGSDNGGGSVTGSTGSGEDGQKSAEEEFGSALKDAERETPPPRENNGSLKIKINLKDLTRRKAPSSRDDDGGSTNDAPTSDMDDTGSFVNGESEGGGVGDGGVGGASDVESSDNSMDCDNADDILARNAYAGELDPSKVS